MYVLWMRIPFRCLVGFLFAWILLTGSVGFSWAQAPTGLPSAQPSTAPNGQQPLAEPLLPLPKEKVTPVQTEKIDQAAQKIGANIDQISEKASRHLGKWINAKVAYGISWLKLVVCAGLLFLVLLCERVVRALLRRRLQRVEAAAEKDRWFFLILEAAHKPLSLFIWVYGVYAALSPLFGHFQRPDGTNLVHTVASRAADVGGTIVLIWVIYRLVAVVDSRLKQWAATTVSTVDDMLVPLVGKTLRIFVAVVGTVMVLQTLTGIDVGPLIASLGIGGLALALAAKESVANFFGALTILFDKPFLVGERILVGGYDGIVESVGFRSIRLRTLTGNLVTVPNEKVVNSCIENVGKRPHIRWLTNITIAYDTPPEKVERAVQIIRNVLENHEGMHPDFPPRVYFNGFNDWSLNIMVIAWYHPPNYWDYQAWLERTCLAILKAFEEEGIEFAFPTRTLYLAGDARRQLTLHVLRGESS